MRIKTTMRYHLTPVRMAVFKKSTNDKCWQRCGPNGARVRYGKWWQVLKKIKIQLPCDPQIPLLGIISEENENTCLKRYMHVSVRSSIIQNSQDVEATMCPSTNEWINKIQGACVYIYTMEYIYMCVYIYTYTHSMEYYSSFKKRMKFCHLQQCGWTQRVLCLVKYVPLRKKNTV